MVEPKLWCVNSMRSLVHYKSEHIFCTKVISGIFLHGPLQETEGIITLTTL